MCQQGFAPAKLLMSDLFSLPTTTTNLTTVEHKIYTVSSRHCPVKLICHT